MTSKMLSSREYVSWLDGPLSVFSLGAGVQSSTMVLMAALRQLPAPHACVFADTKDEPAGVYEWLSWLKTQSRCPIYVESKGSLWASATKVRRTKDGERTYIETAIPAFFVDGLKKGKGNRHCTRDFKIKVVQKKCRELLGLKRITKKSPVLVEMNIGISTDEAHRMKPSRENWIANKYPLIDANMSRQDCIDWCLKHFGRVPPRSACKYCPFRSDEQWAALPNNEFAECVRRERELQIAYASTSEITSVPFFHSSRVPLDQVKFKTGHGRAELDKFGNECEGMCGV